MELRKLWLRLGPPNVRESSQNVGIGDGLATARERRPHVLYSLAPPMVWNTGMGMERLDRRGKRGSPSTRLRCPHSVQRTVDVRSVSKNRAGDHSKLAQRRCALDRCLPFQGSPPRSRRDKHGRPVVSPGKLDGLAGKPHSIPYGGRRPVDASRTSGLVEKNFAGPTSLPRGLRLLGRPPSAGTLRNALGQPSVCPFGQFVRLNLEFYILRHASRI